MKYNEDLNTKFLEHLQQWGRIGLAARSVGLDPQTISLRRKNSPEFDKKVTEALAFYCANVVDILVQQREEAEKKGYWEMSDRFSIFGALKVKTETPIIHDVSGDTYVYGVTNFNAENLYDIGQLIDPTYNKLELRLHNLVFERMWHSGLIDRNRITRERIVEYSFQGCPVTHSRNVPAEFTFDNEVYVDGTLVGILRTREY